MKTLDEVPALYTAAEELIALRNLLERVKSMSAKDLTVSEMHGLNRNLSIFLSDANRTDVACMIVDGIKQKIAEQEKFLWDNGIDHTAAPRNGDARAFEQGAMTRIGILGKY